MKNEFKGVKPRAGTNPKIVNYFDKFGMAFDKIFYSMSRAVNLARSVENEPGIENIEFELEDGRVVTLRQLVDKTALSLNEVGE